MKQRCGGGAVFSTPCGQQGPDLIPFNLLTLFFFYSNLFANSYSPTSFGENFIPIFDRLPPKNVFILKTEHMPYIAYMPYTHNTMANLDFIFLRFSIFIV